MDGFIKKEGKRGFQRVRDSVLRCDRRWMLLLGDVDMMCRQGHEGQLSGPMDARQSLGPQR